MSGYKNRQELVKEYNALYQKLYNFHKDFLDELLPIIDTVSQNKELIKKFTQENNKRPSQHSKDKEEKRLGERMQRYCNPSSSSFDPVFAAKINTLCPIIDTVTLNKELVLKFIDVHNKKPSQHSKDKEEKCLGGCMGRYCNPSSTIFDPVFATKLNVMFPIIDTVTLNKELVLKFTKEHNKRPSQHSKDKEEKCLGGCMGRYCNPSSSSFDPVFAAKINTLCPIIDTASQNKELVLKFIDVHNKKPSSVSKDKEEKRLGECMQRYCSPSQGCFDPKFKKQLAQLCKKLGIK